MSTRTRKGRVPRPQRRPRPTVELLEDRFAPAVADVVLTLTGGATQVPLIVPGTFRIYGGITIEVINNGPEAVSNVDIRETTSLPIFFDLPRWSTEVSGGASVSPTSGTFNIIATASLPVGGKVKLSSFSRLGGGFTSTATVTLDPGDSDPNLSNNTMTITVPVTPAPPTPPTIGKSLYATGTDAGVPAHVKVYDAPTGQLIHSFLPFGDFRGGVRVATGDVTGDGWDDLVVGAGPGAGPHVKVYHGRYLTGVASFRAFDEGFRGGVFVATAHLGEPLIPLGGLDSGQVVVGADAGAFPHVRTFTFISGLQSGPPSPLGIPFGVPGGPAVQYPGPLGSFMAFDPSFRGGVRVAAANIDSQGLDELIVGAGPGAGPHVKVFRRDGSELASFMAYGPDFQGGVYVATVFNPTGRWEVVTGAGEGGPPHVKVFGGNGPAGTLAERASFLTFGDTFAGGVRVAGNGESLIVAAGPGAGPHVKVLNGLTLAELNSFWAYDPVFSGGLFVG